MIKADEKHDIDLALISYWNFKYKGEKWYEITAIHNFKNANNSFNVQIWKALKILTLFNKFVVLLFESKPN